MTRLRMRYTKLGKIRFIGHRDLARVWERALRRSSLRVASTEGFSPRPKVHFGLALSTGFESLAEFIDVDLEADVEQPDLGDGFGLASELTAMLPDGIDVEAVAEVDRGQSLQSAVAVCRWTIAVEGVTTDHAHQAVEQLLGADSLMVERERKGGITKVEVRPSLAHLQVAGPVEVTGWSSGTELHAELRTEPPGLKVAELLAVLAPQAPDARVCRTHQWIEGDGVRLEPLPKMPTPAHAVMGAP